MRPVSILSSLPPKFTPSRTNCMLSPCDRALSNQRMRQQARPGGKPGSCFGGRRLSTAAGHQRESRQFAGSDSQLLTDSERLDDGAVAVDILGLEIVQESTPLPDQHQQATTRVVILRVGLEVLGKVRNPFR